MQQGAESFFVEMHYYSSGLKIAPAGNVARPRWAPNPEWVGYRDEFPIGRGDHVLEFRRIIVGDSHVTWVGYYTKSEDKSFGDRNNYAGVGVWIADQTVKFPVHFLKPLRLWCDQLAKDGYVASLDEAIVKYWSEYLPTYFVSGEDSLPGLNGIGYEAGALCDTTLYRFAPSSVSDEIERFAAALTNASLAPKALCQTPRLLIHAQINGPSETDSQTKDLLPEPTKLFVDVISAIGGSWRATKDLFVTREHQVQSLESKTRELTDLVNEKNKEMNRLQSELLSFSLREQALNERLDQLARRSAANPVAGNGIEMPTASSQAFHSTNPSSPQNRHLTPKRMNPGTYNGAPPRASNNQKDPLWFEILFWVSIAVSALGTFVLVLLGIKWLINYLF